MADNIRAAICCIEIIRDGKTISRGTGALVGAGRVLTAFHVVGNRKVTPPEPCSDPLHLRFPGHSTTGRVSTFWDAHTDWALVEVDQPPPNVRPIPLASRCENKSDWETFGFPDDNPAGMTQSGSVENSRGELDSCCVLQLFDKQAAAGKGGEVKGLSGAPVLIDSALAGVMRFALMRENVTVGGTLYACPIDAVLQKTGDLLPVPDPCYGLPGLTPAKLPEDPFRYLARFVESDAEIFFGRQPNIRDLYRMATTDNGFPLILLYGQSGVGKSSFLDAGLIPRLKWFNHAIYLRRDRTHSVLETVMEKIESLAKTPKVSFAGSWLSVEEATGKPLIMILDQVEEVFTQPNPLESGELDELLQQFAPAIGDPNRKLHGKLILSFRKEWFPEIAKHVEKAGIPHLKFFLEPMGSQAVIDCVMGLTSTDRVRQKYGLRVDEHIGAAIASDLLADSGSPVAPTLQILLTQMWREAVAKNAHRPEFTIQLYKTMKQTGAVMGNFLDRQLAALGKLGKKESDAVASGLAIDLLYFHTNSSLTVQQRSAEELRDAYPHCAEKVADLVKLCSELVLLVDAEGDNAASMGHSRLSHDTLAPFVRVWFERSTAPGPRSQRIVAGRAAEWDGKEEVRFQPWEMHLVEAGKGGTRAYKDKQKDLIVAARANFTKDQRLARMRQQAAIFGVILLVLSLIAFVLLRNQAAAERDLANLHAEYTDIQEALDNDPFLALASCIASARRSLDKQGRVLSELQSGLSRALSEAREDYASYDGREPLQALSVGGQSVVAGRRDGYIQIHQLDGSLAHNPFRGHGGAITSISYSPDGAWFVSVGREGHLKMWNMDGSLRHDYPAPAPKAWAASVEILPNSALAASGWSDGVVRIYSLYGPAREFEIRPAWKPSSRTPSIDALATVRDTDGDTLIAIGTSQGEVALWNLTKKQIAHAPWTAYNAPVTSMDLSARDDPKNPLLLVTSSTDGVVKLWNQDGALSSDEIPFHAPVNSVRLNSAGNLIAIGVNDGLLHVRYLDGTEFRPAFHGFRGGVNSVAFDSESLHVYGGSGDGTLRMLDMVGQGLGMLDHSASSRMGDLAFRPKSQLLVGASSTAVYLWQIEPDSLLKPMSIERTIPLTLDNPGYSNGTPLAVDPNGNWLVMANLSSIRLWDFKSGRLDGPYPIDIPYVKAFALNTDGSLLAIGGESDVIDLWDTNKKQIVAKIPAKHGTTRAAVFSPDGNFLFSSGDDFLIKRWSISQNPIASAGAQKPTVINPNHGGIYALGFSAKGRTLLAGDALGVVTLWSGFAGPNPVQTRSIHVHNGPVQRIRVDPGGEAIYTSSDEGVVRVHSLRTGQMLAPPLGAKAGGTYGLAITSDGSTLASGNNDGSVELWRAGWQRMAQVDCERLKKHAASQAVDLKEMNEALAACKSEFWKSAASSNVFEPPEKPAPSH